MAPVIGIPAVSAVRPLPSSVSCPSSVISAPQLVRNYQQDTCGGGRRIRTNSNNNGGCGISRHGGFSCLCFQCCTCLNIEFVKHTPGFLKISEAILGAICQFLLLEYGSPYADKIGESFTEYLISVSSCLITTVLLLACYIFSKKSYHLIRSSVFETAFNLMACFMYLSSSSYLAFAVNTRLYVQYLLIPHYQVYPALTAAYALGLLAGIIHGIDSVVAYRYFKGLR